MLRLWDKEGSNPKLQSLSPLFWLEWAGRWNMRGVTAALGKGLRKISDATRQEGLYYG